MTELSFLKLKFLQLDDPQALDVSNFAREYGEKLSEITTQCDSLIGLNHDLDSAKTEARIAQGALYDAAQSVSAPVIVFLASYCVTLISTALQITVCHVY